MEVHNIFVKGAQDQETRCKHYDTENDRIAIKFYCCRQFYACYKCHMEFGCGRALVWPRKYFHIKAILCGSCGHQLTINDYLTSSNYCPLCLHPFNPRCFSHHHLYFEAT